MLLRLAAPRLLVALALTLAPHPIASAAGIEERMSDAIDKWYDPDLGAAWLTPERVQHLFPGATRVTPLEGEPPAATVFEGGRMRGYVFDTSDVTRSLGFAGEPFSIAVGLALDGTLGGAEVVAHREPIIDLIMLEDKVAPFAAQYAGIDIRRPLRVQLSRVDEPGAIDGISSATISAVLFNEAIVGAARKVARARGIRLNDEPAIDLVAYEPASFEALLADGSIGRVAVSQRDLAGIAPPLAAPEELRDIYAPKDGAERAPDPDLVIELLAAPVHPPTIGRNLLGERAYNMFVSGRDPRGLTIAVMARGPYLFDPYKHHAAGTLDRLRVVQNGATYPLTRERYRFLAFLPGSNKPRFTQIGLYWIETEAGIDPLAPWRLELDVVDGESAERAIFGLDYRLAERYVVEPSGIEVAEAGPAWHAAWRAQAGNLAVLAALLAALAAILVLMQPLSRRPRLLSALRTGFLAVVLVWLGWVAGAQVTVINLLTWLHAAAGAASAQVVLADPLIAALMVFVLVSFVVWGRGVFCGWLCPFGALQELLGKIARLLRIPELRLSHATHKRLWPVKYVILAGLVGLSLYSMSAAGTAAEVEPFKTAISLRFARDWPYVVYAVALLAAGLSVERFFCRFLCPLGAAFALAGKLRLRRSPLARRPECGSPCQLCTRRCPIQAIEPSGRINMDECFYCLDCQALYHDAHLCPPLSRARKSRVRAAEPAPALA